jgi:hypothetical protein
LRYAFRYGLRYIRFHAPRRRNTLGATPNLRLNARLRVEGDANPVRSATSAKGCRVSVTIRRAACKRSPSA